MKSIDTEGLIKLLVGQARSADLWISQWRTYKDAASVRNASLALGKVFGVYSILLSVSGDEDLPEQVIEMMKKYSEIWDSLV